MSFQEVDNTNGTEVPKEGQRGKSKPACCFIPVMTSLSIKGTNMTSILVTDNNYKSDRGYCRHF